MQRWGALDGLRAIAILLVLFGHIGPKNLGPGGLGVTIFFFLSGYLITSLMRIEYTRTGTLDVGRFVLRRAIRIFPPLYITLFLAIAASSVGLLPKMTPVATLFDLTYLTNYAHLFTDEAGAPIPLWSLDVEQHFYLLFPWAFVLFLAGRSQKKAALACAVACLSILALRFALNPFDHQWIYYWSHTRMDSILFGCCLALWNNPVLDKEAWKPEPRDVAIALAVIVGCMAIRDPVFRETLRYTLQGGALFVLFSAALHGRFAFLSHPGLKVIALLSYALYLCHMPIMKMVAMHISNPIEQGFVGVPFILAYAGAMYMFVERPLARWRKAERPAVDRPSSAPAPAIAFSSAAND